MTLLFKVLYRCYRFASGRWHWAQRRFTRAGLAVLGAFILVVLLAPDTDNNLTYQALPLLLVLLVAAVCLSRLFKAPFSASRVLPRFGTVGCPLSYPVVVRNLSRRGQNGLSLLENLADPWPSFREWLAAQRAEQKVLRSFRFSGRRSLNPFKVARGEGRACPDDGARPGSGGASGAYAAPSRHSAVHRGHAGPTRTRSDCSAR